MPLKYTILPAISIFTNVAPVGTPYETNRDEHFLKIRIKIIHLEEPQQWVTALSSYLSSQSTPWSRWKQCFQRSLRYKSKGVRSKVIKHTRQISGAVQSQRMRQRPQELAVDMKRRTQASGQYSVTTEARFLSNKFAAVQTVMGTCTMLPRGP